MDVLKETEYSKKTFCGKVPSDEDWQAFLLKAHQVAPGCSSKIFSLHKTTLGPNSYDVLANTLKRPLPTVVDLACGEGELIEAIRKRVGRETRIIGIDFSESELAIARSRFKLDHAVEFYCQSAQQLSLKDKSVHAVLCHMAFMLFLPLEPVIMELGRVLKPEGIFAAVMSGGKPDPLLQECQALVAEIFMDAFPKAKPLKMGDSRTKSPEVLKELFLSQGHFTSFEQKEFAMIVKTDIESFWDFWQDSYFISMMPQELQDQIREEMTELISAKHPHGEEITFQVPRQLIVASL